MAYGDYSYHDFVLFRTKLVLRILQLKVTLWLVESDAVWLQDPSAVVLGTPGDIVTMDDHKKPNNTVPGDKLIQGGFQLLRPTKATLTAWTTMAEKLETVLQKAKKKWKRRKKKDNKYKINLGNSGNEQRIMNSIIYGNTTNNVHVSWLDPQLFIPGNLYKGTDLGLKSPPIIVLNNWIKGNAAKIERAKKWNHWYLDDKGRCF